MNDISAITPPIGGRKRGRPRDPLSMKSLAAAWNISVRTLERAVFVRRHGVPELNEMLKRGELGLGPAEYVARWPRDCQREECALGADHLRALIPLVRKAEAEEPA